MSHTSASPSLRQRSSSPDLHSRPAKLQSVGGFILRYGLVFVLLLWEFAKWARTEAEVIEPLMAHSPFLFKHIGNAGAARVPADQRAPAVSVLSSP